MIAKRILRSRSQSDFGRLGAYLLREGKQTRPDGRERLFDYVLRKGEDDGRIGPVRVTNCLTEAPDLAIREILATQALNKRSRRDPTYHLVVSFAPGEKPTIEQLRDIEDTLCAAIGLETHQRLSAVHIDKAHYHMHIAINQIDAKTKRSIEPFYDKRKLMAACVALEVKHGLSPTNHGRSLSGRPKGKAGDLEAHAAEASFLSTVKAKIEAETTALLAGRADWAALHALLGAKSLALKKRGAGFVIEEPGGPLRVRASAVNPALSYKALTTRLGPFQPSTVRVLKANPYQRRPQRASHLYEAYVKQRESGIVARKALQAEYDADRSAIFAATQASMAGLKRTGLTSYGRAVRRRQVKRQRSVTLLELRQQKQAADALIGETHHFTWIGFLQARARAGDVSALEALQASRAPGAQASLAFLTAANPEAARVAILKDLRPEISKAGEVTYRLQDGGRVTDETARVRVDRMSYQATVIALTLGAERFQAQSLRIEGTDAFKREAVRIAVDLGLAMTFEDEMLERERQKLLALKTTMLPPAPPRR